MLKYQKEKFQPFLVLHYCSLKDLGVLDSWSDKKSC